MVRIHSVWNLQKLLFERKRKWNYDHFYIEGLGSFCSVCAVYTVCMQSNILPPWWVKISAGNILKYFSYFSQGLIWSFTAQSTLLRSYWASQLANTFSWAGWVLWKVNQYLCTYFREQLTTAHLQSVKGKKWLQKLFHDQSLQKLCGQAGAWTCKPWICSLICYRMCWNLFSSPHPPPPPTTRKQTFTFHANCLHMRKFVLRAHSSS